MIESRFRNIKQKHLCFALQCEHFDSSAVLLAFGYRANKKPSLVSLISGSIAGEAQENELCVTG